MKNKIDQLTRITEDFVCETPNGTLVVPNLEFLRCPHCGGECIPPDASRKIEEARKTEKR